MFTKLYKNTKQFMKENYRSAIILLCCYIIFTIPLPYYIYSGGGTINASDRVEVEKKNKTKGSLHFAYVKELKGNVASYLLANLLGWEIEKEEAQKLNQNEKTEDIEFRNQIYLKQANQNAIFTAYQKAGKKAMIENRHFYVLYINDQATTDLKVGDEIIKVEDLTMNDIATYKDIVDTKEISEKINITVKRNGIEKKVQATVQNIEGTKLTGISIAKIYDYQTTPKLTLHFKASESGPSGGLMLALAIYNQLVKEDITNGKNIVGTGTIEEDGTVGEIGGVKYKLQGAVAEKADLFLVPAGDNYQEAIKEKKKHNYKITIKAVSTFDEALKILKEETK